MLRTYKIKNMLIRIPDECKRVWDMSENRWVINMRFKMMNSKSLTRYTGNLLS